MKYIKTITVILLLLIVAESCFPEYHCEYMCCEGGYDSTTIEGGAHCYGGRESSGSRACPPCKIGFYQEYCNCIEVNSGCAAAQEGRATIYLPIVNGDVPGFPPCIRCK